MNCGRGKIPEHIPRKSARQEYTVDVKHTFTYSARSCHFSQGVACVWKITETIWQRFWIFLKLLFIHHLEIISAALGWSQCHIKPLMVQMPCIDLASRLCLYSSIPCSLSSLVCLSLGSKLLSNLLCCH